ncbi:MAG: hypothetical protein HY842_03335, partial [Bacteroidetes bacterium]|nr:hypothetical protein [Bacteroidota bacterium]
WSQGQNTVPVLISKDYLALYNFGFAPSQGLPQVTPATVSKLNMELRLSGSGRQKTFNGRIVGFSDRINSILVPPDFMKWANENFGGDGGQTSRLILKVKNPLSKEFQAFLAEKNYEVSTGRLIGSQFGVLLRVVLGVVWAMGLLILTLSMLVFTLNFQLLVAQSAPEIRLLLETGHFPRQISGLLGKRFTTMFGGVLLAVFLAMLALRVWQVQYFENQGFELTSGLHFWVWALGGGFCILLLLVNLANIRRSVSNLA